MLFAHKVENCQTAQPNCFTKTILFCFTSSHITPSFKRYIGWEELTRTRFLGRVQGVGFLGWGTEKCLP